MRYLLIATFTLGLAGCQGSSGLTPGCDDKMTVQSAGHEGAWHFEMKKSYTSENGKFEIKVSADKNHPQVVTDIGFDIQISEEGSYYPELCTFVFHDNEIFNIPIYEPSRSSISFVARNRINVDLISSLTSKRVKKFYVRSTGGKTISDSFSEKTAKAFSEAVACMETIDYLKKYTYEVEE